MHSTAFENLIEIGQPIFDKAIEALGFSSAW
jgi:hypothetical protein